MTLLRSFKAKVFLVSLVVVAALVAALHSIRERQTGASSAPHAPLLAFCAAGIQPPVEAVAREYQEKYGVPIHLQYGGSGTLLSNLRVARTGDLFIAGDRSFIDLAREQGLLDEALPLCVLCPAIATAKGNPKGIHSVEDLLRPGVKVALANPDAASIGKQTRIALEKTGQWSALEKAAQDRGVFKPTVSDVANDIKIGAVDAGIVWDSTAKQYAELEIAAPLAYDKSLDTEVIIGVLKSSERPADALRFARYLASRDRGLLAFAQRGYTPVNGDVWEESPEIRLFSGAVNRVAIEDTLSAFEKREGVRVTRVYNGCGILVSQMKAGDRPDAYFACDVSFMKQVKDLFLDSLDVSETDMIIAVPKGNPRHVASLKDLTAEGMRIGVANAKQSALGALTERMLEPTGLLEAVMKNVRSQTPTADMLVNQLRTETLDAVIVYQVNVSQVLDSVDVVRIDMPTAHAVQPFAVAQDTKHAYLVGRLLDALTSEKSRARFLQTGFRWVGKPEKP